MMLKNLVRVSLFTLLIFDVSYSQMATWKKLKPVESTIRDVERVLGKTKEKDYFVRYELDEGIYYIHYSDGKCITRWKEEWNANLGELPPVKNGTYLIDWNFPEWTVQKIRFYPNKDLPVSLLGINLKKLKRMNNSLDTPDIFEYVDEKNGISYTIQFYNKRIGRVVTGIEVFPASKHRKLLCKR